MRPPGACELSGSYWFDPGCKGKDHVGLFRYLRALASEECERYKSIESYEMYVMNIYICVVSVDMFVRAGDMPWKQTTNIFMYMHDYLSADRPRETDVDEETYRTHIYRKNRFTLCSSQI